MNTLAPTTIDSEASSLSAKIFDEMVAERGDPFDHNIDAINAGLTSAALNSGPAELANTVESDSFGDGFKLSSQSYYSGEGKWIVNEVNKALDQGKTRVGDMTFMQLFDGHLYALSAPEQGNLKRDIGDLEIKLANRNRQRLPSPSYPPIR